MASFRIWHEHNKRIRVAAPGALTTGTLPASYIDMQGFDRIVFYVDCAVLTAGSLQVQVVQATDAAGTGSKNVSGATLPAAITASNKWATVEVRVETLDIANAFRFLSVTSTASGTVNGAIVAIQYRGFTSPIDVSADTNLSANVVV